MRSERQVIARGLTRLEVYNMADEYYWKGRSVVVIKESDGTYMIAANPTPEAGNGG